MVHFIPTGQRKLAILAAQADHAPVLISGGSGTGKGAIAKWIHKNSPRSNRPFVEMKIERPLAEQIIAANGGTLLIPEIAELPRSAQLQLVEFLRTKTVPHPLNPSMKMLAHARVIATNNHPLESRAAAGLFNTDLVESFSEFQIHMPDLRTRNDEFDDIVLGILGEITRELHKEHLRQLTPEVWKRHRDYDWPGNLRELRNVLRITVIAAQDDPITLSDLPEFGEDRVDFRATRDEFDRLYLLELLKANNFEIERTSRATRMESKALLAKIQKLGIDIQIGS